MTTYHPTKWFKRFWAKHHQPSQWEKTTMKSKGEAMSKHTPGPWKINRCGEKDQYPGNVISEGKATGYICHIPPEHEDAEANARLIAAAPDLLEAAKIGLQVLETEYAGIDDIGHIKKVKDAIAKAEGK